MKKLDRAQTSPKGAGWCPRWGCGPRKLGLVSKQNFPNTQALLRLEPLAAMFPAHFDPAVGKFLQHFLPELQK